MFPTFQAVNISVFHSAPLSKSASGGGGVELQKFPEMGYDERRGFWSLLEPENWTLLKKFGTAREGLRYFLENLNRL